MKRMACVLAMAVLAMVAGCHPELDGELDPNQPRPGTNVDESWPGGSLGGWEDGAGVEEAWTRAPGDGSGGGDRADGAAEDMGSAAPEGDSDGFDESDANQGGGLEGGEIDDNEDHAQFMDYAREALETLGEDPMVRWLDVERRHFIQAVDEFGQPLADALVLVFDGDRVVAAGRSHGDGSFAFFPRALGEDLPTYDVEVIWDGLGATATLEEGQERLVVPVPGATASAGACQVDVAFLIDATGSMGGEIERIKTTITSIAGRVAEGEQNPELRLGLVDYRDRGDEYVTHAVNFTDDVAAFQGAIDQLEANGGGDFPEALNEALHEGMRRLDWRRDRTLRLAFIVADAPAHHYDDAQYTYDRAMLDASTMGVTLYPIASGGSDGVAELQLRQMAQYTQGHFIFITEGGGSSHGSEGSEYDVDPADFDVEKLDDLVVRLINDEITTWCARPQRPL